MKDYKERVRKIRKDCANLEKENVQKKVKEVSVKSSREETKEMFFDHILSSIEIEISHGRIPKEIILQDMGDYVEIIIRSRNIFECKIQDLPYSAFGVKGLEELYNALKDENSYDDVVNNNKVSINMKFSTALDGFLSMEYQKLQKIGPINEPGFVFSAHYLKITLNL